MKRWSLSFILATSALFLPRSAFAAVCRENVFGKPQSFTDVICIFVDLVVITTYIVVLPLVILTFFWGLAKFILAVGGDEAAIASGKRLMLWGIIGIFVMVMLWGILSFLYGEFDFSSPLGFPPFLPV